MNARDVCYQAITEPMPKQGQLAWLIYGRDDGSVLAYKPPVSKGPSGKWVKLLQSRTKDHGYWSVRIARVVGRHFKRDVQTVILYAFNGCQPNGLKHAMHLNDDRDDNRRENLSWGSMAQNREMRKEHSPENQAKRQQFVGALLSLNCERLAQTSKRRSIIWNANLSHAGISVTAQAQDASHAVNEVFYQWKKRSQGVTVLPGKGRKSDLPEKDEEIFAENLKSGVRVPIGFDLPIGATSLDWNGLRLSQTLVRRKHGAPTGHSLSVPDVIQQVMLSSELP